MEGAKALQAARQIHRGNGDHSRGNPTERTDEKQGMAGPEDWTQAKTIVFADA